MLYMYMYNMSVYSVSSCKWTCILYPVLHCFFHITDLFIDTKELFCSFSFLFFLMLIVTYYSIAGCNINWALIYSSHLFNTFIFYCVPGTVLDVIDQWRKQTKLPPTLIGLTFHCFLLFQAMLQTRISLYKCHFLYV